MYIQMFREAILEFRRKDLYPIKVEMSQDILDSYVDEVNEEYSNKSEEFRKDMEKFKNYPGKTWGIDVEKGNIFGFYMYDDKGIRYNCLNREWI